MVYSEKIEIKGLGSMNEKEGLLEIRLEEIDAAIIKQIRPVNKESSEYRKLKTAIEKDGQRHPITVRVLSEEEKSVEGAKYGIIDGHHRYEIAKELSRKTILADIDRVESSPRRDIILAYRLNESTIKMTTLEKGKVLYELLKNYNDESNKADAKKGLSELGKEIFGLGTAMSYRALQKYRESIGEEIIEKVPKSVKEFDVEEFKKEFKESGKIILKTVKKNDVKGRAEQVQAIDALMHKLGILRKNLLMYEGVPEEVARKKASITA